jgi:hypothetical protein
MKNMIFNISRRILLLALVGATMACGQESTELNPLAKADQSFEEGDFAAALKSYQWYRSDAKLGASARIQSGHCMLKLGNPSGAAREWRSVWESWPNAPEAASALALEIQSTTDIVGRKKLEDMLLVKYADSGQAKALKAARGKVSTTETAKLTPESEVDQLLKAGKCTTTIILTP